MGTLVPTSMLPQWLLGYRRPILLLLHLLLIPLGYYLAFALRFDLPVPAQYAAIFGATLLFLVPIRFLSFVLLGVHRGWWRHVGMQDLMDLIRATTLSSVIFVGALFLSGELIGLPRSILVLDWIVAVMLFGGGRFLVRALRERPAGWLGAERRAKPALVIGAGQAADRLLRQLRDGGLDFRAVGLVDDDGAKRGMRLHGVPVVGRIDELAQLVDRASAELLVIAIPSATRQQMRAIVERCAATGVDFKIVPSLRDLLNGRATVGQLRDVDVEDLLGRDSVKLDLESVRRDLAGKVVLITGAAGSIGSELARQVAKFAPEKLVLLDQAETPLFFSHLELLRAHPDLSITPIVADVTNAARMDEVFGHVRPAFVFHAAAYKHVPMMEWNVVEAVRNNVFGTLQVAESAVRNGAEKFILISTDKAVNPSSVMGATKRVAERIVLGWPSLRESSTDFRAVRFGNVLGSNGSVIPVFRRQLAEGGPITVTHPDVTRYFMTIPEAVELVLQAASSLPEAARRISMLEMGEPVRIVELAENLIRLSGLEPDKDIPIVFTGLRPGEKLHEELMSEVEATVPTAIEKIRVVQTDEADASAVQGGVARLASAAAVASEGELVAALCALVPECVSPLRELPLTFADTVRHRQPRRAAAGSRESARAIMGAVDISSVP